VKEFTPLTDETLKICSGFFLGGMPIVTGSGPGVS